MENNVETTPATVPPQPKPPQNTIRIGIILGAVLLLLVGMSYFFISNVTKQKKNVSKPTPVPSKAPKKDRVEGQINVKFKDGISDEVIQQHLQPLNARIKSKIEGIGTTVIAVPPGQEDAVLTKLSKDQIVKYAEPDYIRSVQFVPNDTFYTNQWGLANTGQVIAESIGTAHMDINVQTAWEITKGEGIKVAIIDTGIDMSHPEFASKVILQKAIATTYIDDKYGHGTHVAGILAAVSNNGQGISGVCPGCQLIIIKSMDDNGQGASSSNAEGITFAADNGAKVINLSVGGTQQTQVETDAVSYAWNKGAVIVAAAGNLSTDQLFYPAAMQNVLSVAAIDNKGQKASFSDYGTWVKIAAPGVSIFSTLPTHPFNMQQQKQLNVSYDYLNGTSMATPIVSGVAGLVWATQYGTSNQNVVDRIRSTAASIPGTGLYWSDGRIDAASAVGSIPTPTPTPSPTVTPVPTATDTPTPIPSPTEIPTPQPTDTPTQPPASTATPLPPIVPTYYCLGPCPTLPLTETPIPTDYLTLAPTDYPSVYPTEIPTEIPTYSSAPSSYPTQDPCANNASVSVQTSNGHHHKGGGISSVMNIFMRLILQLLNLFLGLFGGNIPIPAPTPTPGPIPTLTLIPTPTPTLTPTFIPTYVPSVVPSPTYIPYPSSSTEVPYPSPTSNPCLSPSPTPSPTPSAMPSTAAYPSPSGITPYTIY